MIHPDIQAMLVRERSATLMAAAAAYRRGRQARSAATEASRAADLRFFTDVDHRDHEALGALDHVRGGGVVHRGSGIAEYEIDLDGTSSRAD